MVDLSYEREGVREVGPSVMVRPWKAGNYLRNRSLVRFRILRMAFCIRDYHETRRARAHIVRCHHDSGNNKAASLLRILRFKVSTVIAKD